MAGKRDALWPIACATSHRDQASVTAIALRRCRRSRRVNALANGGYLIPPTFLKRSRGAIASAKVCSSHSPRENALCAASSMPEGTAKKATCRALRGGRQAPRRGGGGRYQIPGCSIRHRILRRTIPRYQILIMLDDLIPCRDIWLPDLMLNAVPTAGRVNRPHRAMLGVEPRFDLPPSEQLILAKVMQ